MPARAVLGYAGNLLRVDLTNEATTAEPLEEATLRRWLGGTGLGPTAPFNECSGPSSKNAGAAPSPVPSSPGSGSQARSQKLSALLQQGPRPYRPLHRGRIPADIVFGANKMRLL